MLTKNRKATPAPSPAPASAGGASLLLGGLNVTGDIVTEDDVQIDGIITGNVRAAGLTVGEGARIEGEVVAMTLRVHGRIEGTVRANWVELAATAKVRGDVLHGSLRVEPGARIDGRVCCLENPTRRPGEGDAKTDADTPTHARKALADLADAEVAPAGPGAADPGEATSDEGRAGVVAAVIEVPARRAAAR